MALKSEKKSRKGIELKTKLEMIEKHDKGSRINQLSKEYGFAHSTVSTILRDKARLKDLKVSDSSKRLVKGRELIVEMEKHLMLWIKKRQVQGEFISASIVCSKAKRIFDELKCNAPELTSEMYDDFKASKGWFERFKTRTGFHNGVKRCGTISSDNEDAVEFEFAEIKSEPMEEQSYVPQLERNDEETGRFSKKLPDVTNEEVSERITGDLHELDPFTRRGSNEAKDDGRLEVTTSQITEFLGQWEAVKKFVGTHPCIGQTEVQVCEFDDKLVSYYRKMLKEKRAAEERDAPDDFLSKRPKLEVPSTSTTPEPPEVRMEGDSPSKN